MGVELTIEHGRNQREEVGSGRPGTPIPSHNFFIKDEVVYCTLHSTHFMHIKRSRVWFMIGLYCATTLGNVFTPFCLCTEYFGTGVKTGKVTGGCGRDVGGLPSYSIGGKS